MSEFELSTDAHLVFREVIPVESEQREPRIH
jgi:hypothetical protein